MGLDFSCKLSDPNRSTIERTQLRQPMEFIFFVAIVWIAVYAYRNEQRRRESMRALEDKVDALERRIEWVRSHPAAVPETKPAATEAVPVKTEAPTVASTATQLTKPQPVAPPAPPIAKPEPPRPAVAPPVALPAPPPAPRPITPVIAPGASASVRPAAPVAPMMRPAAPAAPVAPPKPAVPKKKFSEAFEEVVGTNWLPKLGVVILFIGLASWIASQWGHIPVIARVALFYTLGGSMLASGAYFESKKKEQYLVLGRALIGVGWATIFLTTFAVHHVPAVRLIDSLALDLFLAMGVVAAMVWHTLRYESQLVTGLCFFLGFFTIAQSHTSAWSLLAGVMLAAGLVVIVLKRRWYELEIFGILASFLNHAYWLYPIVEQNRAQFGHNVRFDGYVPSLAVLAFYWAVYRFSYVLRKVASREQEALSTVSGILNTVLLLGIAYYQSLHQKEVAFWALLALGSAEIALALLPRVRVARPVAFRVLSIIGWCLIVAAAPVRFVGDARSILWLITAEAFFFAGIFSRERLFQRFGSVTALIVALYQIVSQGVPYLVNVFGGVRAVDHNAAIVVGIATTVYYINAHLCRVIWPDRFDEETDEALLQVLSYAACATLLLTTYLLVPSVWASTAVAVIGLIVAVAGNRLGHRELLQQSHLLAAVAFADVLAVNAHSNTWQRTATFLAVSAALYVASRVVRMAEERTEFDSIVAATYTWFGSGLISLLLWFRFQDSRLALLWAAFGLALAIVARHFKLRHFWFQAHALAIAAIFRVLAYNLFDTNVYRFGLTGRMVSVAAVAAVLYAIAKAIHIREFTSNKLSEAESLTVSQAYTWAGTSLLSLLVFYETRDWRMALIWTVFALGLGIFGKLLKRNELNWQATLLTVLAFAGSLLVNMYETRTWHGVTLRLISVTFIATLFYALNRFAPQDKLRPMFTWGGSLLASWLIWYELHPINVALAWTVFGVLLLEIGLTQLSDEYQRRNLRFQAHVAFVAAFARLFFVNFNAPRSNEMIISVAPLPLLFFYSFWRTMGRDELRTKNISAATLMAYVATASVISILRFTVEPDWVILGWTAMFMFLMLLASVTRQLVFRDQALLVTIPIAFRGLMHNVYQVHVGSAPMEARNALILSCITMIAALPFAFKLRDREAAARAEKWKFLILRPEQLSFFLPITLLLVLFTQLFPGVLMTLSWGVLAVTIFSGALAIGERSFRLAGLGLLLICVAKIIVFDAWNFNDTNARYLTLILMGAILLTVSFLYGRFRDKVRELL
jgi:uncharacterized membrane protein